MSVSRSISLYDLMEYSEAKKAILENDKQSLNKFLHYLGFDVTQEIEYEDCLHRPLMSKSNQPVYGTRIVGFERSDSEWEQSGNMSWEQKVNLTSDPHLRVELAVMGKSYNNTDHIISNIKGGVEEL